MFKLHCSCGESKFVLEKPIGNMDVKIICTVCGETFANICEYNLEKKEDLCE